MREFADAREPPPAQEAVVASEEEAQGLSEPVDTGAQELAEKAEDHLGIQYDEKVFEPDGVFGSRGLGTEAGRKIVKARPHVPYEQGGAGYAVVLDPKRWGWQLTEQDTRTIRARIDRAPGILMERHTVALPGVVEGPVLPEYRPDWPIFTGEEISWHDHEKDLANSPITRSKHVASKKVSVEDLEKGGGLFEGLAPYGYGADHFGVEREGRHPHVDVAKYLFKGQPKIWVPAMRPHKHEDYKTLSGLRKHVFSLHMTYSDVRGVSSLSFPKACIAMASARYTTTPSTRRPRDWTRTWRSRIPPTASTWNSGTRSRPTESKLASPIPLPSNRDRRRGE
jgi:hypothetical protein